MKKLFFGMLVAVAAFGGSVATYAKSFTHSTGKADPQWFRFHGGDETVASNYTATVSLPTECGGNGDLCAIYAEPSQSNSNRPNLDTQSEESFKD